jgi:hypothetical protein
VSAPVLAQDRAPLVLAAASLQESMTAAADAWAKKQSHHRRSPFRLDGVNGL